MPRIRTIKPEFSHSESMGRISRDARLAFIQMWTIADDAGRLRDNPRMMAATLFPFDDDALDRMDAWLNELAAENCIIRYSSEDGNQYIQIRNWSLHQKIDRPSESKIPAPDAMSIQKAIRATSKTKPVTQEKAPNKLDVLASEIVEEWNLRMPTKCRMTIKRMTALRARAKDPFWMANWRDAIDRMSVSSFCLGQNGRGWTAHLEWFLRPDTVVSLIEGKYDDRDGGKHMTTAQQKLHNSLHALDSWTPPEMERSTA